MSQQGYIGRNPGDGRTIVNRQTTHVTTGVQTSFTMTTGYEIGYLDVYLNGIKQTETLDYTASDGSTINFSLSFPPVNGDVLEFVAFETLNITNIKSARRNFSVGQDLDVSGKVTIGSSLTVASDLVVNGTFTTINTEILDVEDKTVGIASTSSPSNTTADGAGIVIYGGSDGDKSLTWNSTKSNFVLVGGGVSIGTGVTISTPAANVLAFSVNSAEKARFNNFGAFTVGYEGEAWHESTYVGVLQAGSGAWIGQTPGASARAEWTNNAYYDAVNTRWEYIAADEANRIVLENGELKLQSADAGSADGAITWNEKLKMTVGGDFKIGAPTGIGITISSSGNVDSIGIVTASSFVGNGANLTSLNASNIGSGTVPTARLGSGTASSSTFLRGDSTFAAVTSTTINSNADNRVITGSGTADTLNAESNLTFDGNALTVTNSSSNTAATFQGAGGAGFIGIRDGDDSTIAYIGVDGGKLKFQTSGSSYSDKVVITTDGHVGINETNPDSILAITDSENTTYDASQASHQRDAGATLRIQNNSTTTNSFAQILLRNQSSNVGGCRIVSINKGDNSSDLAITTGDTSESVRIDSSGRVLIGTTTEGYADADNLTIRDSGNCGVTIRSGTSNYGSVFFSDATSGSGEYDGFVQYDHINQKLTFGAGASGAPKLSINSSGNSQFTGIVTATEFVPTVTQLSHRNLIINGDCRIAQRGTSSSSTGYKTVDRFKLGAGNTDEVPQQYQGNLGSHETPYEYGFRKTFYIVNGNQTGGAGSSDYVEIQYKIEAQDIANSGWNYTSSSSYLTLSFWLKSSVSQNFYGFIYSADGTAQRYIFETGTVSANSWNKIVVKIPGGSNVQFDDNVNEGLVIKWIPFYGTDKTNNSGTTLNTWANYNGAARTPDNTSTWYTTNNSTFNLTGVQLEVGSEATPFEHKSYEEEFKRCQRYFQVWDDWTHWANRGPDNNYDGHIIIDTLRIDMRANPSITNVAYGWIANGSSWVDGSNSEAASIHHDPSSTYPGRYVKITGVWNWDSNSQSTIAVKFVDTTFDAEL